MIYRKQTGYDSFRCIADKCPKSCCEGWQIVIDETSLQQYLNYSGDFKDRLQRGINDQESIFEQNEMRCSMLAASGLCDLQSTLGEDWLCDTCRQYPRHIEEYPDLREYSLSLSCPEAVRMLMDPNFTFSLTESEDDLVDDPDEFEDFDYLLFDQLTYAREKMMDIASNQEVPLQDRLDQIISISRELQELYDQGESFEMNALFDQPADCSLESCSLEACSLEDISADSSKNAGTDSDSAEASTVGTNRTDNNFAYMQQSLDLLIELEVLESSWTDLILETRDYWADQTGFDASPTSVDFGSSDFFCEKIEPAADTELSLIYEKVFQSLFFTYFCGSIYDGQIYARTMIAAMSVRWLMMIRQAHPQLPLADTIYLYSREVEHSDPNINALISYFEQDLDDSEC